MIERDLIIVYQAQGFKDRIWPIMVSDTLIMDSGEDHQHQNGFHPGPIQAALRPSNSLGGFGWND